MKSFITRSATSNYSFAKVKKTLFSRDKTLAIDKEICYFLFHIFQNTKYFIRAENNAKELMAELKIFWKYRIQNCEFMRICK